LQQQKMIDAHIYAVYIDRMTLNEFIKSENAKAVSCGKPKMTDHAFGQLVGISQAHVNRLRNGKAIPSLGVAAKIASVTRNKVTANDWCRAAAQ
jgi:DNA-binding XRE family transcriptional regulator